MSARYTGGLVYNAPGGWSVSFNGSNQYLSVASQTALGMGAGDFTYEAWIYVNEVVPTNALRGLFDSRVSGATGCGIYTSADSGTTSKLVYATNSAIAASSTNTIKPYVWTHVAVTRSSGTVRGFINGALEFTVTDSRTFSSSAATYIGTDVSPQYFNGYISSARIIKGTAVYTANFTPPTGALLPISGTSLLTCAYPTIVDGSANAFTITNNGSAPVSTLNPFPTSQLPNPALGGAGNGVYTMSQYAALKAANLWPAYDPYYKNVTLNLHGNAGAVLPFNTDASTNNFQVTQVGDTKPSNYTPFIENGYWSNAFDGSSFETVAGSTNLAFGTGDFTIECWVNFNSVSSGNWLDMRPASTNGAYPNLYVSSGTLAYYVSSADRITGGTVTAGTWYHIALCRSGTSTKLFLNGTQVGSTYTDSNNYVCGTNRPMIGGNGFTGSGNLNAYISNFRFVKGTALYTTTFTPPTAPLTAISGTSLLTCQSNRFIDNSASPYTITTSGSPSVNPLQPFTAPTGTSAYGSGYFDGSGDYLSCVTTPVQSGTDSFTIEAWVYPTASRTNPIITRNWSGNNRLILQILSSGAIDVWVGHAASGWYTGTSASTPCSILNAWYHVALVRNGSTITAYVNGVSVLTGSTTATMTDSNTTPLYIGYYLGDGSTYQGYISNLRVVNGTAVYTSAFTPPTSPLTAIANTSLLTVQTNAPSQNNTFLDSSTNNFVITRNGNTTQGTFSPYGATWSNYFGGSGNYLSMADSTGFNLSGGNFTIECWIYPNGDYGNYNTIVAKRAPSSGSTAWELYLRTSTGVLSYFNGSNYESSVTPTANTWNHIAGVYDGTYINLYLNGTRVLQSAVGNTNISASVYIGTYPSYDERYIGYISNLRITKGAALYSGTTLTVPTAPLTNTVPSGNVVLLTCQNNRFVDNSAANGVITVTGSPTVQRFNPFGLATQTTASYSGWFDGSGDYIATPSSTAFAFGTGNYTMEAWICVSAMGDLRIWRFSDENDNVDFWSDGRISYYNGSSSTYSATGVITANTWKHIAVVRNSGTVTLYVNGTSVLTQATTPNTASARVMNIGGATNNWFPGLQSNVRVVKGTAVYTSAFTTPTSPLTAISGTSLLTCQSSTFIDNSTNAFTLTVNGNTQPITANPFPTSTLANVPYSASVIGGSGYFDGSGDYLTPATSSAFAYGTGDLTFECWIYATTASDSPIYESRSTNSNTDGFTVTAFSSTVIRVYTNGVLVTATVPSYVNAWTHVAYTRQGSTNRLFVNGLLVATATASDNYSNTTAFIGAGRYATSSPSAYFTGYISDVRILKGTAQYTATFTPPTAPLAVIANTSLLLNYTNAAIIDNGMANDLETLGNAQLSTNIKKYGSASIYLDGSGDYLTTRLNSSLQFGTGNFTVECWTYLISRATLFPCVFTNYNSYTSGALSLFAGHNSGNTTRYQVAVNGAGFPTIQSTTPIVYNTWVHLAVVRSSGTITLYVNGVANGTYNASGVTLNGVGSNWGIGTALDSIADGYLYGYIDEFRVTKGVARYTANFTPPTSQVQDQ